MLPPVIDYAFRPGGVLIRILLYTAFAIVVINFRHSLPHAELLEHLSRECAGYLAALGQREPVDVSRNLLRRGHGPLHPRHEIGDDIGRNFDLPVAEMFHEKRRQVLLVGRLDFHRRVGPYARAQIRKGEGPLSRRCLGGEQHGRAVLAGKVQMMEERGFVETGGVDIFHDKRGERLGPDMERKRRRFEELGL